MVQPEKVNCLLAPELRLPAASDSSFLTPRCDTAVLIATAIFYLGEILHGGYATSDLIAKFINFHFPAVKYLKVLTDLSLLSKSADKFVKYSWMFERHPSSHSLSIRLKPETLLSTFAICQEAVVNLSLQCMRCSSLIMLIYDLTPPYWDNYYAHRKQPQVVSNAITTPNTTTSTTTTPAPVIKLRNSTSLISTSAAQLSTATPQPLPTASPSISTSGASTTVSSTILPMPQKREKDPTPLVPAITKTIDTNTPLISPANIKRQPPTELEDSLPNIPSNTDNMPIEQDEEEGNQENDAANKPDLEIQVLIGMAIILYRIKEFFASDNGENNYYEGFAPEWDTPINQYILAQPFTLKQLVEWLDEVFVYYKRDNRIKVNLIFKNFSKHLNYIKLL